MVQNNPVQHEWLLANLKLKKLEPTGKREIGIIDDIDSALAAAISGCFDNLVVTEPRRDTKSFEQFLTRTQRDRITIGWFSDVQAFLTNYRDSASGRKDSLAKTPGTVNKQAMPIINIGRTPSFSVYDGGLSKDIIDAGEITIANKTVAIVSTIPVVLEYSVWVLSEEIPTLGYITSAIASWMRLFASRGSGAFMAQSRIAGSEISIMATIQDQRAVTFTDLTTDTSTDRIFGSSAAISVVIDLPIAHFVQEISGRVEVVAAVASDNSYRGR